MMKMNVLMKHVLAGTVVMSLAATGCVRQDAPPTSDIESALPTADQVSIKLPTAGQSRTVGQLATYYLTTRVATLTFNGGAAWVLTLLHTIVQFPVTSVSGNTYTWGPWSNALDPAEYRLDVVANGDGTFGYALSGRNKTQTGAQFQMIITGDADPTPGELQGNGHFTLDLDASHSVDPIDHPTDKGVIDASYDLAAKKLSLHIATTDDHGAPAVADYAYAEGADGSGDMTFNILGNAGGTATPEQMTMRSRWTAAGAGRGDARIAGGDLGTIQAIGSECWGTDYRRTYYTDNASFEPTEGDVAACAFADVDLPPVQ
ncbi:hypothetical protein BH11MYX1_BH11MYX1_06090 [soil metagenome]